MTLLKLKDIGKKFAGSSHWAVHEFDLIVERGDITALLGESGCGKTTLLRIIAGFEAPDTGTVIIDDQIMAGERIFVEPQQRHVGIVFQDYALFPHKTVMENILFGLFRLPSEIATQKANEVIDLCCLGGFEKRYPHQLSGGQKQRVALARALAPQPRMILFDEPFSNLDSMRRHQMRTDIRTIIKNTRTTAVFVTHDTRDVMAVADNVCVMHNGKALQTGKPDEVRKHPCNQYVGALMVSD